MATVLAVLAVVWTAIKAAWSAAEMGVTWFDEFWAYLIAHPVVRGFVYGILASLAWRFLL